MAINFKPLIKKKKAITYLDDSLLQSHTRAEMFTIIHEYHQLLREGGFKAAPDKTHFFSRKVKFLGHVISEQGIQPVAKRVKDLQNLQSPESKRDEMKVLGCLDFYSCYIKNLHVNSQTFYDIIKDTTPFKWTDQHEELFKEVKTRISEDTILAVPPTEYPFHKHVDSSNVGKSCILVRKLLEGKRIVSILEFLITPNSKCQPFTANYVREYLPCKHANIISLDRPSRFISTVITHPYSISGEEKDSYLIESSNIKSSSPNSTTSRSSGHPDQISPFPIISVKNVTLSEATKLQLQHKEITHGISFYDQDGHKVHYTIKHEDEQNASYNIFYPIMCQQGNARKTLRLKNDGNEHHVEDNLEDNEVLVTMQDLTDYFKLGKTINQYKQLCPRISPASSTSILKKRDYSDIEQYDKESTDDETEIAELNFESQDPDFRRDHAAAHELFRTKTKDKSILKKPISFELFPHVDTPDLIQKLSDFARDADLDIQTLLEEQLNDPVLQVVRKWIKTSYTRPQKTPAIKQSEALLSYYNNLEQLFVDADTNLLCYREPIQDTCKTEMKICDPLSFFLPLFSLAHTHSHSGHLGIFKTSENIRQYLFSPGRYKWIVYLIEDCIDCQINKTKRHDLHKAPLKQWGELEKTLFKTIHIDHKGPLRPSSNSNTHYLVVVDAFSPFHGAYPVTDAGAQTTINALEKWITSYFIPQKIVHDNGSAFKNSDFINWTKEFGITLAPRTTYSPWTNGKVEVQNQHLTRYWRNFMNQSGTN